MSEELKKYTEKLKISFGFHALQCWLEVKDDETEKKPVPEQITDLIEDLLFLAWKEHDQEPETIAMNASNRLYKKEKKPLNYFQRKNHDRTR